MQAAKGEIVYCVGTRRALAAVAADASCVGSSAVAGLHQADCYDLRSADSLFVFPSEGCAGPWRHCSNGCKFKAPQGHPEVFRIGLLPGIGYFKKGLAYVQHGVHHETPECAAATLAEVFTLKTTDEAVSKLSRCMYCV
jgi:hypothetical protein